MNYKMIKSRIKMALYRVIINYMDEGAYEANISTQENNIIISPSPPGVNRIEGLDLSIPFTMLDNVAKVNVTTIRLELFNGLHVDITFGNPQSKSSFRRRIRADSDEDSGVSSGTPSPPL
ncbi:uncharacterized protein [Euwallacea similis]|uniref:uncharacterized protein n=1 Tax=Euwallacea similis TaxID=1736056 RepID=UPI00344E9411